MKSATVQSTAEITGWSVRMLHYLDAAGLVCPPRSPSGYRLYGQHEIAHLRRLRQLLADHHLRPADLQVALRLRSEPALRHAVDDWLGATTGSAPTPSQSDQFDDQVADAPSPTAPDPSTTSWLRFEQDKHSRALELRNHRTPTKENA